MTGFSTEEIGRVVDEHNRLRREVGVPEMEWDATLDAHAQTWADAMARDKKFEHSKERHGEGENIAWGMGYGRSKCIDVALEGWGEREKLIYIDHGEPVIRASSAKEKEFFLTIGHYTQMVWDGTTHVGVAIAKADDGSYYTCARYSPTGNYLGQHPYGGPLFGKKKASKRTSSSRPLMRETPPERKPSRPIRPRKTTPKPAPAKKRTPPKKSVPAKKPGPKELVLAGTGGKKISIRIKTVLGKRALAQFGGDAQFCSEPQFTLEIKGKDWIVAHNPRAKNETLLNGKAVTSPATLKNGDQLAVGRESKGITKLPLKVQIR